METYYDLLQRVEWKTKRLEILERDRNQCSICANYNVIREFTISYIGTGTNSADFATIIIYDKLTDALERCRTGLKIAYFKDLFKLYGENSIIVLSTGNGPFRSLMGIVVADTPINLPLSVPDLNDLKTFGIRQQQRQENYLNNLTIEDLKKLTWANVKSLHIHHKYYWLSKNPWEYPDDALQTLCWKCHENLHSNELVPVYDDKFRLIDNLKPCPRCFGAGYIPIYKHVQNGICFQCNGKRFIE